MTSTVRKSRVQRLDWQEAAKDATWREQALCRDLSTSIFYPEAETSPQLNALYTAAKKYCEVCPVREACLDAAMREEQYENSHRYGIRGGKTPTQRRGLHAVQRNKHGYSLYTMGCRCDICTNANRLRVRDYRANRAS